MKLSSNSPANNDRADVLLFPPLVGFVLIVLGIGLHVVFPVSLFPEGWVVSVVGILTLLFGIGLQIYCLRTLKSANTTPLFKKPTVTIVQQGPYGRSRNPIYVAVLFQFLGLALIVNTLWFIILLPLLFVYLHFGVIAREEQYLERKFGKKFQAYKSRVPKWI